MKANQNNLTNKYVESRTIRENVLDNVEYDFLDKIKIIPYLTDDMVLTVQQVANYYEVPIETIRTIIKRHRAEFENDGIKVLSGDELEQFLCLVQSEPDSKYRLLSSLTIITKRALLRCGMLLTNSDIAVTVRNYLLNIEENTSHDRKRWEIQREVSIIERKRMCTAIKNYVPDTPNKKFAYPNYTNLIYKILFDAEAKKLREQRGCADNDALRDSFSEDELKTVEEVESVVVGLLTLGFTYKQINDALCQRFKHCLVRK